MEVIENEYGGGNVGQSSDDSSKNPNNVAGGLKAYVSRYNHNLSIH